MWETCRRTVIWRRGKGHARRRMRFSADALPVAIKQRDTIMQNTVEHSRDRWHQWSTVTVRFGELWIFMMMIYWVAIGARTASKLSPPCLKGNALPILKTLRCSQVKATSRRCKAIVSPAVGSTWRNQEASLATPIISLIHCVICAHKYSCSCNRLAKDVFIKQALTSQMAIHISKYMFTL